MDATTATDRPVQPHRGIEAVGDQVAGHPGAGGSRVEAPKGGTALGHIFGDGPVLQKTRPIMKRPAETSLVDNLLSERNGRHAAVIVPDHVGHAGVLDRRHHRLTLSDVHGERLLAKHRFSSLGRRDRDIMMQVVRHADIDRVDIIPSDQLAPVGLNASYPQFDANAAALA